MEFNSSVIEWQGVFKNVYETVGDISKIKYQTDEADEINETVKLIRNSHLLDKYLFNAEYVKEIQDVLKLFIANTKLKNDVISHLDEYSHIFNIMPLLSKCVLTNIVFQLNLTKQYCEVISSLPIPAAEELLSEMMSSLKFCKPDILLKYSYECCKCIIRIVSTNSNQNMEILIDVFNDILKDLSHINVSKVDGWRRNQIYELMGDHILILLKLIRRCSLSSKYLCILLDKVILNCLNIFQAVTVDVFCLWSEIQLKNGQHLQTAIAGEAYYVIDHVKDYKRAKELIQMLKTIAKKPKSINDVVEEANVQTIRAFVDKCDENQHLWFQALLQSSTFEDEQTIKCLNNWSKLCTPNDVCNIIIKTGNHSSSITTDCILKCCQHLSLEDMQLVIEKYFDTNRLTAYVNLRLSNEQLTLLLNKISGNEELDKNLMKDVCLLFLQNPEFFIITLFERCLKKSVYTDNVKEIFKLLKNATGIQEFVTNIVIKMLKKNPPALKNIECYKELINVLVNFNYLYDYIVLCEIFVPELENLLKMEDYETLLYSLQILNLISMNQQLGDNILPFIILVISITDVLRYNFTSFSMIKQCVIDEAVGLLRKYRSFNQDDNRYCDFKSALSDLNTKDPLTKYYVSMFCNGSKQKSLLMCGLNDIPCHDEFQKLTALTMVLQRCCSSEWIAIAQEIQSHSCNETLQKFVDIFRIIHAVVVSAPNNETTNRAFKFYLNQYAIIIKDIFKPQYNSFDNQLLLSEKVTYMLAGLDEKWRSEGLQLIELLPKESLKHLSQVKKFVITLVTFKDPLLAKAISQVMVG